MSILEKMQTVSVDNAITSSAYARLVMKLDKQSTATFEQWLDLTIAVQAVRTNPKHQK